MTTSRGRKWSSWQMVYFTITIFFVLPLELLYSSICHRNSISSLLCPCGLLSSELLRFSRVLCSAGMLYSIRHVDLCFLDMLYLYFKSVIRYLFCDMSGLWISRNVCAVFFGWVERGVVVKLDGRGRRSYGRRSDRFGEEECLEREIESGDVLGFVFNLRVRSRHYLHCSSHPLPRQETHWG